MTINLLRSATRLAWAALLLLTSLSAVAQQTVTGTVLDKDSREPIVGAAIIVSGTTTGTVSDLDGSFSIRVDALPANIDVSFLGYQKQTLNATSARVGSILLAADAKALEDVIVKASIAVDRKTPVALSTISPEVLEEKLGGKELPEVLKSTPSIYATRQGGGYGDSEMRMRGFTQANIAVMVNGVPVNDMEWGGVYWSNWTGLSDVLRTTQTQRGLGASKLSSPSVGGTVAYITKGLESKRGGTLSYQVGNDGDQKILASVSSGMNERGWAFTVLLAKKWGDGYVQGTEYESYNWFFNIAKRLNDRHQLSLTGTGAPQWHNQRNSGNGLKFVQYQAVKDYMNGGDEYRYNPSFGYGKNGERKNANRNQYHKPQFSLNHQWQIDNEQSLASALYLSIGRGNGYSGQARGTISGMANQPSRTDWYGASSGDLNMRFRKADGTFAYDEIQELNEQSSEGSLMAMSVSKNDHTWFGLISNYDNHKIENLDLSGGIDFRWYKGTHTNELIDLYNGDYFIDDSSRDNVKPENNIRANDPNFKYEKLHVGDVVYRDYDGYTVQGGIYGQAEYSLEQGLNAYVSASVSNTTYWRVDRFYYDKSHEKSETVDFWGFTVKGGANYNFDAHHNVFFNLGYISRAPFYSGGAFLSSAVSNETNREAVNEKCLSYEVGYGFTSSVFNAKFNGYYTKWMDKTQSKRENNGLWTMNMSGVDARHMGLEFEMNYEPTSWFNLTGMFSIGDWIWDANTTAFFYDDQGYPIRSISGGNVEVASGIETEDHARMTVVLDKVKVGGSAQLTAAAGVTFKPMEGLRIGGDWNFFGRNYADWEISSNAIALNSRYTYGDPWKMPNYSTVDVNASYTFDMGALKATFSGNVDNLFDALYIQSAKDGEAHNWETSYGFYGFGRTYSCRLKLTF